MERLKEIEGIGMDKCQGFLLSAVRRDRVIRGSELVSSSWTRQWRVEGPARRGPGPSAAVAP